MMSLLSKVFLAALFFVSCLATVVNANENHRLRSFRGDWKFKLGDNMQWADPTLNDSRWDEIYVPARWEDEGFPGYDGYAWYRRHFDASPSWTSKDLLLEMGKIDDVDEVYVNGQLIGSMGSFPPDYSSAYNTRRSYPIPQGLLNPDEDNVIAVRVYDDQQVGGITNGPVGIYEREYLIHPDFNLPSVWKFKTGDNMDWKGVAYDDSNWKTVRLPAYWEAQGFKDYDGYAWYRVKFQVPPDYDDENLVLLVGKIDDFDETYVNGERVGRMGPMPKEKMDYPHSDAYKQLRAYMIPSGLLQPGKDNVIAVRVYDCWRGGGIYDGPIGITTRRHYLRDKDWYRHVENWFDRIIDDLSD